MLECLHTWRNCVLTIRSVALITDIHALMHLPIWEEPVAQVTVSTRSHALRRVLQLIRAHCRGRVQC